MNRHHIEDFNADQLEHDIHASEHHGSNLQGWQVEAILQTYLGESSAIEDLTDEKDSSSDEIRGASASASRVMAHTSDVYVTSPCIVAPSTPHLTTGM
jgi:hypothetical protein